MKSPVSFAMIVTAILVGIGAIYKVHQKAGKTGIACIIAYAALAIVVHFVRKTRAKASAA